MSDDSAAGYEPADTMAVEFFREIRRRLEDTSDQSLARRLAPAVSRLTDRVVIAVCDRLARGDMTGFFELMLENMTEGERREWRRQLSEAWFDAALSRWNERQELRREILETILFVKALALS